MPNPADKYDSALLSILEDGNSVLDFLSTVFNFLARRTDFYYAFAPGEAEKLASKVFRSCDPTNRKPPNGARKPSDPVDISNEIMSSVVAQEVECVAEEDNSIVSETENLQIAPEQSHTDNQTVPSSRTEESSIPDDYVPPIIPTQKNSESYNGAVREKYSWSQSITELDVTIKLPSNVKSSKDLQVNINSGEIGVSIRNGDVILNDTLQYKIRAIDSFWTINERKLLIHLEKLEERWWIRLLNNEEPIDLSKIDCSRPMDELPEDHIAKINELKWNQVRKMQGLPTSDEIRNIEVLRQAWDAEGSPFKGQPFDPSVLRFPQ